MKFTIAPPEHKTMETPFVVGGVYTAKWDTIKRLLVMIGSSYGLVAFDGHLAFRQCNGWDTEEQVRYSLTNGYEYLGKLVVTDEESSS